MPDTELDPISFSSDTDYEQMEGFAGNKGEIDKISARNDEKMYSVKITNCDDEINTYYIPVRGQIKEAARMDMVVKPQRDGV